MRREHILLIWIGGLVLAVLLYLIGPDRFFAVVWTVTDIVDVVIRDWVAELGTQSYAVVRALAIAIYCVFAVLAVLSARRGHRGLWALTVVTAACLFLVWRPFDFYPVPFGRWLTTLILVGVGAGVMTRRLTAPPYPPHRPS